MTSKQRTREKSAQNRIIKEKGPIAVIVAALIGAAALIYVNEENKGEGLLVEEIRQGALTTEKARTFLTDLTTDTSEIKVALFAVRDNFNRDSARRLEAKLAQLEVAFENWKGSVDINVSEATTHFGEKSARLINDKSNREVTIDQCGIVVRWGEETELENCAATFSRHNSELQKLQDSRNAQTGSDGSLYQPAKDVIIPQDVHTSFRLADGLIQFRIECLKRAAKQPEAATVANCPSDTAAKYAMQQRINLAGVRASELSNALSQLDGFSTTIQ